MGILREEEENALLQGLCNVVESSLYLSCSRYYIQRDLSLRLVEL